VNQSEIAPVDPAPSARACCAPLIAESFVNERISRGAFFQRPHRALIWEQSGGEPWSFSVIGESLPRVFPTIQDAIREARAARPHGDRIRVGLTGLSTTARSAAAAIFAPCLNITAARQISNLAEGCKATPNADPIYCAIAAYRGSWDRPDAGFADAVRITVEEGNAPNFDMPKDAYFDPNDVTLETITPRPHPASTAPEITSDDYERGWSSALFPAKPAKPCQSALNRDAGVPIQCRLTLKITRY
jgi:hypothetical protein